MWWPELEAALAEVPEVTEKAPERDSGEVLAEILLLVRRAAQRQSRREPVVITEGKHDERFLAAVAESRAFKEEMDKAAREAGLVDDE